MNHSFHASLSDKTVCSHCKFTEVMHGNKAICESCSNEGPVDIVYGNMLMCKDCQELEKKAYAESMKPENQEARVESMNQRTYENAVVAQSRAIDNSIQVRTDIFNASTTAIVELKAAIDGDEAITNKPYELAKVLTERFTHYKQVIFDANEKIVEAANNQRAIQVYLNELANKLRAEEREKLKLADINYKPKDVRPVKPTAIKTTGTKKGKLDKVELRKYATELGISEFTLQMLVVQKGVTVETAANMLRKSIAEAKS